MSKQTFMQTVTPEQIASLTKQGFSATAGTLPETSGVVLSYVVDGATITFTVEKKPFYVSVSAIQSRIKDMLTTEV